MTNTAFMHPGSEVTLIAPDCMPDTLFWFVANLRRLRYLELRCLQERTDPGALAWDNDLCLEGVMYFPWGYA